MADYNPYAPYVVGQELVPIIETEIQFNPTVDHTEYGYALRLTEPVVVRGAYISRKPTEPGEDIAGGTKQVNIYRYPLQSPGTVATELIPVNSSDVTGMPYFQILSRNFYSSSYESLSDFYSYVLSAPENKNSNIYETDHPAIPLGVEKWASDETLKYLSFGFATSDFEDALNGNRILNVSLFYSGYALQKHRTDGTASLPPLDANGNSIYDTDHVGASWTVYDGEYWEPWMGQAAQFTGGTFGSDPGSTIGSPAGVSLISLLTTIKYPPTYTLDALNDKVHFNADHDYNYMGTYTGSTGANDPVTGTGVFDIGVSQYNSVTARWEGSGSPVKSLDLGDIVLADATQSPIYESMVATDLTFPQWTYNRLKALDVNSDAASKRQMLYTVDLEPGAGAKGDGISGSATFFLDYLMMQVLHCGPENRLAAGAVAIGDYTTSYYRDYISTEGMEITAFDTVTNKMQLGPPDPPNPLTDPVPMGTLLQPGNYVVTISSPYAGDRGGSFNKAAVFPSPRFGAVRPLHNLPSLPGVQVTFPYSSGDIRVGYPASVVETVVIPQIMLEVSGFNHATGAYDSSFVLPESQAYGTQITAQVYGSNAASQVINDDVVLSEVPWPWIRFYARRLTQTTQPLAVSIGSSTVSISVDDFDELSEITADGWREVTLRFDTYPEFGDGDRPTVTWSSYGATAGGRWEILGAASLIKRSDDSLWDGYVDVGADHLLPTEFPAPATYGTADTSEGSDVTPVGATWFPWSGSHSVASPTYDEAADITVLFAQDPPMVTGLAVAPTLQTLSGIDPACGVDPCCIPTGLWYNQISWAGKPPGSRTYDVISLYDTFGRSVTGSWGDLEFGDLTYSLSGSSTGVYVDDGKGYMTVSSGTKRQTLDTSSIADDFDLYVTMTNETSITTSSGLTLGVWFRVVDSDNRYEANVVRTVNGTTLTVVERSSGSSTTLWTETLSHISREAGSATRMRILASEDRIKVKVWPATGDEPTMWNYETTVSPAATGTDISFVVTNSSATSRLVSFADLQITPPQFWFGYYELQRRDEVDDTWQTIMKATNPAVTTFNDFEARPGYSSEYRIRCLNNYEFASFWSESVFGELPEIGADGGCLTGGHLLMFTTNEIQDGTSNLAYSSVWIGGQVEETFSFPESGFVQLQQMYNRDFYTAFRPMERGGEQFDRQILLEAAAVSPGISNKFKSLRDMAWADVNYVCVRDEDGNRWLTSVTVPSGNMLRNRRLKMAQVHIVEVTDVPTPVDPSPWTTVE